jgi:membrane-anchored protein YejM (alkaline phosphatase superfamily)
MMIHVHPARASRVVSVVGLGVLASVGLLTTRCHRAPERPNVVLIVVDSLRPDALGCYGSSPRVSPSIDRIAADGVRFERAIAQAPWNVPSISSLMTSAYPSQHGQGTTVAGKGETVTLAETLAGNGYRTAAFLEVSWPLLRRGFQTFEETAVPGSEADPTASPATKTFDNALGWMRGKQPGPFFVFIHTNEVQSYFAGRPYAHAVAKRENPDYKGSFLDWGIRETRTPVGPRVVDALLGVGAEDLRYLQSLNRGAVAQLDSEVGRLDALLREQRLAGDTIVIVTSSNGDGFRPDLKRVYHGGRLHDDQLHVPLIVRWPDRITAGSVKTLVESLDIAPTLLTLAGLPSEPRFHGHTLVAAKTGFLARLRAPRFTASADAKRTAFAEESALLVDPQGRLQPTAKRQATLYSEWIQIIDTGQGLELYDLKADPAENHNLAATHAEAASGLRAELERHLSAATTEKGAGSDVNDQLRSLGYVQ